jgi:hypothetical protein
MDFKKVITTIVLVMCCSDMSFSYTDWIPVIKENYAEYR